ncbi:bifunctional riboflavin kinase/FAD synthetase [Alkalibacter rhizosphaerae]|uniref:Riboflavin biosynthesis protein n=1 Tax=Alkalibacter rhizosphaerae TaxID=2815577 RepID=A0A974XF26_9FIRM|nr:bifunctional riboflavin kinase/FAD synthetase [Alkalibacter rhizosphaerae]QSX08684.1 bifunctional riboflavin kinase/FAD synthetase [Alkalibacter rhizosphaerae]
MEIIDWRDASQNQPTAIALGFFDGIHLGHRHLMEEMIRMAGDNGWKSCVLTFKQHPLTKVFPKYAPKLITSNEEKLRILQEMGIDQVVFMEFTDEVMNLEPRDFVKKILVDRLKAKGIVVGFNYNFGKKGTGNSKMLESWSKELGYDVKVVDPIVDKEGQVVSSTFIRNLIVNGKVDRVAKYLGRDFSVLGKVIRGKGLGRQFHIPTANIKIAENHILPDAGVYYTTIEVEGEMYHGLTNVGHNPTFENHPFSIETFIYDFDRDIYGNTVQLFFHKKIRKERKFDSVDALIAQIQSDIAMIREKYVKGRSIR